MKVFMDRLVNAVPYFILSVLSIVTVFTLCRVGLTFEHFIDLLKVVIWPTIVLIALLFFRKVFTYLFFSMESFNFFGVKGTLKDVNEMIREKANELWKNEKDNQALEAERAVHQKELDDLRGSKAQASDRASRAIKLAEELLNSNSALNKTNADLNNQVQNLLSTVSVLQRSLSESVPPDFLNRGEESKDVGQTDAGIDSSPTSQNAGEN